MFVQPTHFLEIPTAIGRTIRLEVNIEAAVGQSFVIDSYCGDLVTHGFEEVGNGLAAMWFLQSDGRPRDGVTTHRVNNGWSKTAWAESFGPMIRETWEEME